MSNLSDVSRTHRDQNVSGLQALDQRPNDLGTFRHSRLRLTPRRRGQIAGGHFPVSRRFAGTKDLGHDNFIRILQTGGQFVQQVAVREA